MTKIFCLIDCCLKFLKIHISDSPRKAAFPRRRASTSYSQLAWPCLEKSRNRNCLIFIIINLDCSFILNFLWDKTMWAVPLACSWLLMAQRSVLSRISAIHLLAVGFFLFPLPVDEKQSLSVFTLKTDLPATHICRHFSCFGLMLRASNFLREIKSFLSEFFYVPLHVTSHTQFFGFSWGLHQEPFVFTDTICNCYYFCTLFTATLFFFVHLLSSFHLAPLKIMFWQKNKIWKVLRSH